MIDFISVIMLIIGVILIYLLAKWEINKRK